MTAGVVQGRVSGLAAVRWEMTTMIAPNIDWFISPIKPGVEGRKRFALDDSFTVVKHTLQLFIPVTAIVNIQYKFNNITKVFLLNGGDPLVANAPFQFDLILVPGSSYNIQHQDMDPQNVAAIIAESFNVDI